MKRFIAALLCVIILLCAASCEIGKDGADAENGESESSYVSAEDAAKVVVGTGGYSVTLAEFRCLFNTVYNQWLSSWQSAYGSEYSTYLSSMLGFDISKPLKEQMLTDSSQTYLEYFISRTKQQAKTMLLLCEWADENGVSLSDSDLQSVESDVSSYVTAASANDQTIAELLGDSMGVITEDVIREYRKKDMLAQKAANKLMETYKFSDEEIDEEFNENLTNYGYVDFLVYTFSKSDSVSAESAKKYAEELSAVKSADEFKSYVENYYRNILNAGKTAIAAFDPSTLEKNNVTYAEDTDYLEWMFKEGKVGECFVSSDDENAAYSVFFLLSEPGENEYDLKNVRHILFKTSSYDTAEEAKAEAERVYGIFKEDPTEDNFAKLANEYSEDRASEDAEKTDGGLIEDIDYGQLVSEFEDWAFDDARQPGDTDIIRTTYGYHIMYFSGNGEHVRKGHDNALYELTRISYNADLERIENDHEVTYDDAVLELMNV